MPKTINGKQPPSRGLRRAIKALLLMNLTAFFLVAGFLNVSASVLSQTISFSGKNVSLPVVFSSVEKQTGFVFMYPKTVLNTARPVTISAKQIELEKFLTEVFKAQPLEFIIKGKSIFISAKNNDDISRNDRLSLDDQFRSFSIINIQVLGDNSQPLSGASVTVKKSGSSAMTDADGVAKINVNEGDIVLISYVGYESNEYRITSQHITTGRMNVSLVTADSQLDEVQVVAYGAQRKKDVTGSIATIGADAIAERPSTNPLDALSSKVAGLNIASNSGAPGGQFQINIRGISSINGGTSPLVVIDGVIDANLELLNPNDIERVDVLKDASSTAIYGVRGSNGVILITTKHPKNGLAINYNGNVSIGKLTNEPSMVDANGFLQWFEKAWTYDPSRGPVSEVYAQYPKLFNTDGSAKYNVDWNKAIAQNAITQRHYLSASGGTEKTKQSLSLGYQNEKGLIMNTYYRNITARFSQQTNITNAITFGGDIAYSTSNGNTLNGATTWSAQILRTAGEYFPIIPVQYPDGTYSKNSDFLGYWPLVNPVYQLNTASDIAKKDQLLGNVYLNFKLLKGLEFKSSFSTNINTTSQQVNASRDINLALGYTGINGMKSNYWQLDNFLTYNRSFKSIHSINATLGSTVTERISNGYGLSVTNTQGNILSYYNIAANSIDPTLQRISSNYIRATTNAYFARVNYSLLDKYLFTLTGRVDGSSVFGEDNKYTFFPSGAIGWILSNEKFLQNNKTISFLKIRASYGSGGNSAIAPYSTLGFINLSTVFINNQGVPAANPSTLANPSLQWEKTDATDIGLDLHLLDDRIVFTADFFRKVTKNLLLNKPVSVVSGYSNILTNIGSLQNMGVELSLSSDIIKNRNWNLNIAGVFSSNKNKILQLSDNNKDIYGGVTALGYAPIIFRVGEPVGSFWAVHREGTWGTKDADQAVLYGARPGDAKYTDVNGDNVINNDDASIRGNMFPDFTAAFTARLKYKNWQLSAEIQMVHGNEIFNGSAIVYEDWAGYYGRGYASVIKDAWTPENQNTMVRQVRLATDPNFFQTLTGNLDDRWLEDGSFIRGRSINLMYNFSQKVYSKLGIKGLTVYANVQNFFISTKYRGFDPEVGNTLDQSVFGQGIGWQSYPRPRTYTAGINFNL